MLYRRFLAPAGVRPASITVIENPEAIVELVRAGLGISLLPRSSIARDAEVGAVVARPLLRRRGGYRIGWSAAVRRRRDAPWVDEILALLRGRFDAE